MLKNYIRIEVDLFGSKYYLNDEGNYHRLDGPAIEWSDGSKLWCINGNSHRNIDPADESSNLEKRWLFIKKLHRIGGSIFVSDECWCINGKEYAKKQYFNKVWKI